MSPSGDNPQQYNPNALLYSRQRSRIQEIKSLQLRAQAQNQYDLANRDSYGDKLARIYPRELQSPGAAKRYATTSSPHPITSPLLSALSTTTNTAAQYTSDWTKSLPFFTSPHAASITGSPPNHIHTHGGRDGISNSPPTVKPKSHPNNGYPSFGTHQQQSPHAKDRRASMYSQIGNGALYRGHAPLPHEDQAHFHGNVDFDSIGVPGYPQNIGLSPGENGYFCGWDTLSTSGHGPSSSADNILLVGYEGGLRVYRVARRGLDIIGRLEGLRGAVIGAKILPWTCRQDPGYAGRPYVALTIHGPIIGESSEHHNSSDESAAVSTDESSPEPSIRPPSRSASATGGFSDGDLIRQYQTTVEVFSLSDRKHVTTLYSSPTVTNKSGAVNYKKIPPIGDLKVDANGKFVVVASGISGEIFIFSPYTKRRGISELGSMRCVGKIWTTVQLRETKKPSSPNGHLEPSNASDEEETQHSIPLFSLSNRWIATVPPNTSVFSLNGKAHLLEPSSKPPGLTTHVPPTPPPRTTCAVDIPEGSEFMSRMSREITQNALRGARWVSDQGVQAWKSYWSQPTPVNGTGYPPPLLGTQQHFPPTHDYSNAMPTANNDPMQVTIHDLHRLLIYAEDFQIKTALIPLATFELPSGCSFLSFAPSGLHMVTVSKKGDEQFVWSLMKMRDPRSAIPGVPKSTCSPYVRQIKKFTRMTMASTVDVVWSAPHGERFSILTERGTIHAHEIPASVFQWPPFRRERRTRKAHRVQHERPGSPQGRLSSAANAISGAGSWIKTAKTRGLTGAIGLGQLGMTPANMNSKSLKAGIRNGIGAVTESAQAVYHAGDNKLHLGSIVAEATQGSMRWMTGRDRGSLAIVAAGTVIIYAVKQTSTSRKGRAPLLGAKISKKSTVFSIPPIPDDLFAPALKQAVQARESGAASDPVPITGNWQLRALPAAGTKRKLVRRENWHKLVEAETNPPYQPFHTDRRVFLYAFGPPSENSETEVPGPESSQHEFELAGNPSSYPRAGHQLMNAGNTQWLYGEETVGLRCIREGSGVDSSDGDIEENFGINGGDSLERLVELEDGDEEGGGGHVVVTTVRRKGREEEDFFEDGCEVLDFAEDRV